MTRPDDYGPGAYDDRPDSTRNQYGIWALPPLPTPRIADGVYPASADPRPASQKLEAIPPQWSFERADVARGFDAHVREQLPWYDLATNAVVHVARHFLPAGGLVYDLGASPGNIGRALADVLAERKARLIPIEPAPQMAEMYEGPGKENLLVQSAETTTFERFDVAIAFLTMMFVPVAERAALLATLQGRCRPGGVIIIFDKTDPPNGYIGTAMRRLTLAGKIAAHAEPKDVIAKELSLGGVQRPLTAADLPNSAVEWFRFGEFAGWTIEPLPTF